MQGAPHGLGNPTDAAATGDGSLIGIAKRIRDLLGGTGSVRITDGTDTADVLDLTSNNGLAVAVLDGNGDQITSFGGETQYTEDAAAAANPVGTVPILIRQDTPATLVTTDGDNVGQRGTNYGAAYVQVVTSAGAFIDSFGGAGGTAMTDDAAFTPATTSITPMGAMFDDTLPDSVDEGDGGVVRMSGNRNLYTTIRDAAGNERGVNVNASNQLAVSVDNTVTVGSHAVTNAGTFAVQVDGNALTALQLIDDTVHSGDAALSKYNVIGAVLDDAATATVTENQANALRMSSRRALLVEGVASGTAISTNWAGTSPPIGAGTEAAALRVTVATDSTGVLSVDDNGGAITVDNAGTFAVQDATAQASLSVMDDWDNAASDGASVSGDVAHDSPDAGEPVKLGAKALDLKANPTGVTANDRTNLFANRQGMLHTINGHVNTLSQGMQVTDADGAQTDAAIVTAAANVSIVVTKVSVTADNANTVDVSCRIGFGTANTPAADAAQTLLFHPGIPAGGGVIEGDGSGILGIGASGEDVRVTCEDPVTGSISIIVTYFTCEI